MTINWFLLWIGTIVFGIAYVRMRDKIPTYKRNKFETIIMVLIVVLLLINISFQVIETKNYTEEINDCIRYYRYYDTFNDTDFYFIQNCYDVLGNSTMLKMQKGGIAWKREQVDLGFVYYQNKTWEVNQNE